MARVWFTFGLDGSHLARALFIFGVVALHLIVANVLFTFGLGGLHLARALFMFGEVALHLFGILFNCR